MADVLTINPRKELAITRSERWMDFHTLRMQGLSIRKIAAFRGVSRNAVRRALRSFQVPTGKRKRVKGVKLAPYADTIVGWLSDPIKSLWTGERMFDELELIGYSGGKTVLKDYLQPLCRKLQPAEQRFYVSPGQQMQVDWGELGVVDVASHRMKLYVFVAVTAWSRALYDGYADVNVARLPSASVRVFRGRPA